MINLTPGTTSSVWMSLRESVPYGNTASFKFVFTNDISGSSKTFYPTDLQPTNKWSRFLIGCGTPENLSQPRLDLAAGMWSYVVSVGSTVIETGKALVNEDKTWKTLDRPAKTTQVLRR